MFVCNCFGVTEEQVCAHRDDGARTPRDVASACKAGTDCGSCVRRIQALLGRGTGRRAVDAGVVAAAAPAGRAGPGLSEVARAA